MHLSRIVIENFRNFSRLDVAIDGNVVVVGENKVGKSNLMHALRLLFDPSGEHSEKQFHCVTEVGSSTPFLRGIYAGKIGSTYHALCLAALAFRDRTCCTPRSIGKLLNGDSEKMLFARMPISMGYVADARPFYWVLGSAAPTTPASSNCSRSGRSRRLSIPKAAKNCSVVTKV